MDDPEYPRGYRPGIILYDDPPYLPFDIKIPSALDSRSRAHSTNVTQNQDQGQTMTTPEADVQHSPFINGVPPTIVEVDPAPPGWYEERERTSQQERAAELAKVQAQVTVMNEACEAAGVNPIAVAFRALANVMQSDPSYAWTWHCNMAMPIHDSMSETQPQRHALANVAAARIMAHVFDVNTMSTYESDLEREHVSTPAKTAESAAKIHITNEMVNRFLSWPLPPDFAPDGGISFQRESGYDHPEFGRTKAKPIGTNLFTAIQARAMLEHSVNISEEPQNPNAKE